MKEYEMTERIRASAETVQIPEGLMPKQIQVRLAQQKEKADTTGKHRASIVQIFRSKTFTAAAVFLICGAGIFATCRALAPGGLTGGGAGSPQNGAAADQIAASSGTEDAAGQAAADGMSSSDASQPADTSPDSAAQQSGAAKAHAPKRDAGELYVVADNYGQIYDLLEQQTSYYKYGDIAATGGSVERGEFVEDLAWEESADDLVMNSAPAEEMKGALTESASSEASRSGAYSKTNVVTQGVDESDIIKTDGTYLYILHGDTVKIVDISGGAMKEAGELQILMESASSRVMEMYVEGNILNLILEKQKTQLTQQEDGDVFYMDSDTVTELLTYDISDKSSPSLSGSVTQDGSYKTSRKIGNIVYLFSDQYMETNGMVKERAILDENTTGWIPVVNGTPVAADCIYLPEQGNNGLLVTSVDVTSPEKTIDQTLILNHFVEVYVSTGSLYLYHSDYSGSRINTQIAKFSLQQGNIDAVGAASAEGEVYDTFAIQEQNGKLRLLTTDWSGSETENALYLFDADLNLTGTLKGIAKGEEIYAARFIGNTAYFVTYRNTDPLFAVDLSDEKNPKILSELKITGFSEYLHLWGEDKLFGIGYETDPDTGSRKGLKLTMFDISDPSDLSVAGSCVIKNIDYSPALYQYKCVLADPEENVIGFAAKSYRNGEKNSYLLFSWEDGSFREILTESLGENGAVEEYRGIYAGSRFYLVSPDAVTAYDREDGYRRIEKLTF